MTATDKLAFAQAFNRLAVATRLPAKDADAAAMQVYFDGLSDLSVDAVTSVASDMERRADWFPKLSEWRSAARRVHRGETLKSLPPAPSALKHGQSPLPIPVQEFQSAMDDYLAMRAAGVSREDAVKGIEGLLRALLPPKRMEPWHFECEACEDSGWETRSCHPGTRVTCGLRRCDGEHPEHTYAVACWCRETNKTYQRMKARMYGTA